MNISSIFKMIKRSCIPTSLIIATFFWLGGSARAASSPSASDLAKTGKAHYDKGEFDKAAYYLEKALERAPKSTSVSNFLAMSYLKMGNIEKAIEQFERVVETASDSEDAKIAKGWLKRLKPKKFIIAIAYFSNSAQYNDAATVFIEQLYNALSKSYNTIILNDKTCKKKISTPSEYQACAFDNDATIMISGKIASTQFKYEERKVIGAKMEGYSGSFEVEYAVTDVASGETMATYSTPGSASYEKTENDAAVKAFSAVLAKAVMSIGFLVEAKKGTAVDFCFVTFPTGVADTYSMLSCNAKPPASEKLPVVAVARFQDMTGGKQELAENISDRVFVAMLKSGSYSIIPPTIVDDICGTKSQSLSPESGKECLKKANADYLIIGAVTKADSAVKRKLSETSVKFYLGVSMSLVDIASGKILHEENIESTPQKLESSSGLDFSKQKAAEEDLKYRLIVQMVPSMVEKLAAQFLPAIATDFSSKVPKERKRLPPTAENTPEKSTTGTAAVETAYEKNGTTSDEKDQIKPSDEQQKYDLPKCDVKNLWKSCVVFFEIKPPDKKRKIYPAFWLGTINAGKNKKITPRDKFKIFINGQLLYDKNGATLEVTIANVSNDRSIGYINPSITPDSAAKILGWPQAIGILEK